MKFKYTLTASLLVSLISITSASSFASSFIKYSGKATIRYNIKIQRPNFKNDSRLNHLQYALEYKIDQHINHFLGEAAYTQAQFQEAKPPLNTLTGKYSTSKSSRYVSVKYTLSGYRTSNPYPNNGLITENYSVYYKREINLQYLFSANYRGKYLNVLSNFCRKGLRAKNISGEEVTAGTAPIPRNFSHWNITSKGLLISFAGGSIGPHAIGMPTVLITKSQLKPYLSRLGKYYFFLPYKK
jgi:hypothetical protein